MKPKKKYNREKTLAIVTGIVCALIFLSGTALGAIHSMMALGAFGVLSVACYLIADSAIIWAAFIDYHEDGGAMEWSAMAVKYILSAYILFSGGCIAWLMISEGLTSKAQVSRGTLYQETYDKCMQQSNAKPRSCERMAKELLSNETSNDKQKAKQHDEQAGFIKTYVDWPLFKYFPGLLGLFGLFVLALVSKLAPQDEEEFEAQPIYAQPVRANIRQSVPSAPFTAPSNSLPSVSNGLSGVNGASFRFKLHGNNVQITWRWRKKEYACGSISLPEANIMTTLAYDELAQEIIRRRKAKNPSDQTALLIEPTTATP